MASKSAIFALLLAVIFGQLYSKGNALYNFVGNTPGRISKVNTFQNYEIRFAGRARNCEDAVLLKDQQLAVLACDPGRDIWNVVMSIYLPGESPGSELFVYNYAASGPGAGSLTPIKIVGLSNPTDFPTLGIEYDEATSTLFVTNHAAAGPRIELFHLDLPGLSATHIQTLTHPLLRSPNSIQLLGSHELYVSNDHYFHSRDYPILAKLETYLALPAATVVHLTLGPRDRRLRAARVVARVPFANGVALLNGSRLAVSSSSNSAVHLFDVAADRSLKEERRVLVPFSPDNIEIKDDRTLLIAGHPHVPSLGKYAVSRHVCRDAARLAAADEEQKETCRSFGGLSAVAEWSEEGGLRSRFVESIYGTSATALWDETAKFGLIAGLYGDGIFTWRE